MTQSGNSPEPFRFYVSGAQKDGGGEIWEAYVRPDVEDAQAAFAGRVAFRIHFSTRSQRAKVGTTIQGAMIHGDRGGGEFFKFELLSAFAPAHAGTGGLAAIHIDDRPDVPFSAEVQANGREQPWTALVRFDNGGELVMLLDDGRHTGELRPIEQYKLHVLSAMASLLRPR